MTGVELLRSIRADGPEAKAAVRAFVVERMVERKAAILREAGMGGRGESIKSKLSKLTYKTLRFDTLDELKRKSSELTGQGIDHVVQADKLEIKLEIKAAS